MRGLTKRARLRAILIVFGLILVLGASACSRDDGNGSADSDSGGSPASASNGDAAAAGAAAAGDKTTKLPPLKAGILHVQGNAQSDLLVAYSLQDGLDDLGIEWTEKDPQGNPGKTASDLDVLIGQDPDVIFGISVEPAVIQTQLRKMKARNIPYINMAGTINHSPLVSASPVPSDYAQSAIATQYLLDVLASESPDGKPQGKVASFGFDPIHSLLQRRQTFEMMVGEENGVEVVAQHQVNFEDPNADIQNATQDIVQANPDLKAIFTCCDFTLPPIVAGLRQAKADDVKVVSVQLGTPAVLDLIANGDVDAVGNAALGATAYMALNEFVESVAEDRPICRFCWLKYEQQFAYGMIDKGNLDVSYELRPDFKIQKLVVDYPAFFKAKWDKEFTQ